MALSAAQLAQSVRQIVVDANDLAINNISRADVQAALVAVDAWATANSASFNSALPEPFKSAASTAEKALLLAYVCLRRAGK